MDYNLVLELYLKNSHKLTFHKEKGWFCVPSVDHMTRILSGLDLAEIWSLVLACDPE